MSDYNPETPPLRGVARVLKAFVHSFRGLRYAFQHEAAIRQEFVVLCAGALVLWFLQVPALKAALLLASLLLWIVVELLNSAIEAVVDRIGMDYHPLSGAAKDMGSAAVLICGIAVGMLWTVILLF